MGQTARHDGDGSHVPVLLRAPLQFALSADIPEYDHRAQQLAILVPIPGDQRLNQSHGAVAVAQIVLARESVRVLRNGIRNRLPGIDVECPEDCRYQFSGGGAHGPSRQFFRDGVHECNAAGPIGGDDRVSDVPKRRRKPGLAFPELLFRLMFGERHLDVGAEIRCIERLGNVTERARKSCSLKGGGVGVSRQVDDRYIQSSPDLVRGVDSVFPAIQMNVHQDEIGSLACGEANGVVRRSGDRSNRIPHAFQTPPQVESDQRLVLHQQNFSRN